jgi:RNA-directed DNA polymerase
LSNIYLHEVLDVWFEKEAKPRLLGHGFLVRYADDFVMGFTYEEDARRVLDVLPKRFGRYGLELHPEKTRLLDFGSPRYRKVTGGKDGPGTFDFLGFTFFWAKSMKGNWVVKQKTAKKSFTRSMQRIREWCRINRHLPLKEQQQALTQKLRGHYGYFGVTGNASCLGRLCHEVKEEWWKWLKRRSQTGYMSWREFCRLLDHYPLPRPRMRQRILVAANP